MHIYLQFDLLKPPPHSCLSSHVVSRSKYFTLFLLSLNLCAGVTRIICLCRELIWKVFIINLWKPDISLMGCFFWDYIKRPESQTCISRNNPPEKWGRKWLPTSQIYSLENGCPIVQVFPGGPWRTAAILAIQYNPGFMYDWSNWRLVDQFPRFLLQSVTSADMSSSPSLSCWCLHSCVGTYAHSCHRKCSLLLHVWVQPETIRLAGELDWCRM